ncbi:hypothetical protein GBAR_LOCUS17812 [Geodia barretti]|uniref:Uncharacterized protein n=1 Tax=Geodia barretti TaxID=519541 RepID=A0AA35SMC2_GEOBA|nr:hypothetical protein GBAR_LOCUS17812 [Geodia barretti]
MSFHVRSPNSLDKSANFGLTLKNTVESTDLGPCITRVE